MTLYVNFPPRQEPESAGAEVTCSCVIIVDSTGEVCICTGACDFDACCGEQTDPPVIAG